MWGTCKVMLEHTITNLARKISGLLTSKNDPCSIWQSRVLAQNEWRMVVRVWPKQQDNQRIVYGYLLLGWRYSFLLYIRPFLHIHPESQCLYCGPSQCHGKFYDTHQGWGITIFMISTWNTHQPAPINACIHRPKLVVGVQLTGCGLSLQYLAVSLLSSTRFVLFKWLCMHKLANRHT